MTNVSELKLLTFWIYSLTSLYWFTFQVYLQNFEDKKFQLVNLKNYVTNAMCWEQNVVFPERRLSERRYSEHVVIPTIA